MLEFAKRHPFTCLEARGSSYNFANKCSHSSNVPNSQFSYEVLYCSGLSRPPEVATKFKHTCDFAFHPKRMQPPRAGIALATSHFAAESHGHRPLRMRVRNGLLWLGEAFYKLYIFHSMRVERVLHWHATFDSPIIYHLAPEFWQIEIINILPVARSNGGAASRFLCTLKNCSWRTRAHCLGDARKIDYYCWGNKNFKRLLQHLWRTQLCHISRGSVFTNLSTCPA